MIVGTPPCGSFCANKSTPFSQVKAFYHSLGAALFFTILFWTFALLAALAVAKDDATDGLRSAADFMAGGCTALGASFLSSLNARFAAVGITRGAFGGTAHMRSSMQVGRFWGG